MSGHHWEPGRQEGLYPEPRGREQREGAQTCCLLDCKRLAPAVRRVSALWAASLYVGLCCGQYRPRALLPTPRAPSASQSGTRTAGLRARAGGGAGCGVVEQDKGVLSPGRAPRVEGPGKWDRGRGGILDPSSLRTQKRLGPEQTQVSSLLF